MAKKNYPTNKSKFASKSKSVPASKSVRKDVRNTAVPRVATPAPKKKEITREMIAIRAYEIFASGNGGSEHDNWIRAELELRGK